MKPKLKQWGKLSGIKINSSRKISKNVYQVIFFRVVSVQSVLPCPRFANQSQLC